METESIYTSMGMFVLSALLDGLGSEQQPYPSSGGAASHAATALGGNSTHALARSLSPGSRHGAGALKVKRNRN